MKSSAKWAVALSVTAAAVLAACGGGGLDVQDTSNKSVASATTLKINASTGAAVASAIDDKKVNFASGVPALGTTGSSTDVTLDTTPVKPTFAIVASGGTTPGTASGELRFGSCIFVITFSTFPSTHPLALGNTVTVEACEVKVDTTGQSPSAGTVNKPTTLTLAGGSFTPAGSTTPVVFSPVTSTVASTPVNVPVVVNTDNTITVNNVKQPGTVVLIPTSGGAA